MKRNSLHIRHSSQNGNKQRQDLIIHQQQHKEICVSDFQSYSRYFLKAQQHNELHVYITNCKISVFRPTVHVFKNLRTLSLDNNNLESIQGISRLYMPSIRKILLCTISYDQVNNKIISIKPLIKLTQVPELNEISLSMNPLLDPYLYLSKCDIQSLKELRLYQLGKNRGAINMCAKLNCFFLNQFGVQDPWQTNTRTKLLDHLFRSAQ